MTDVPAPPAPPARATPSADPPEVIARVEEGLELVDMLARQLRRQFGPYVQVDDLASQGREALLAAARSFDPDRAVPFRRWANLRIRGAMIDGVRQSGNLPRRVYRKLRALAGGRPRARERGGGAGGRARDERCRGRRQDRRSARHRSDGHGHRFSHDAIGRGARPRAGHEAQPRRGGRAGRAARSDPRARSPSVPRPSGGCSSATTSRTSRSRRPRASSASPSRGRAGSTRGRSRRSPGR